MSQTLDELERTVMASIAEAGDDAALEAVRVETLGKKGVLTARMRELGKMTPEERQEAAPRLNALKTAAADAIAEKKTAFEDAALNARLETEKLDVTLPAPSDMAGRIHPIAQVFEEIIAILSDMGFDVAEGPDIETDFYNFTALNFPPKHPAREMHDTFFLKAKEGEEPKVLRTHTSPVQIRYMENNKPPLRIIAPGRTYRCDSDQTHTPMFHQVEGLVIGKDIHMGHLKGTLEAFVKAYFEIDDVKVRFRPHHFPFTEPSAEMDIGYERDGDTIRIGSGENWMEILGCGMVHPNVLRNVGYDPDEVQGFAWGMGVDRLAMLKYGIPDLRAFFAGDARWLKHYGFNPFFGASTATGLS